MKVSKQLQAPAAFIFDKLIESCLYDIKQHTGQEVEFTSLSGFHYQKSFVTGQKATITITEVLPNERYQFQTVTAIREFLTTYKLKALKADSCEVICEEKLISRGRLLNYNDMLTGFLLGWQKKRQMRYMLAEMAKQWTGNI